MRLSSRYISGRQLPDKAVSVLDTACARVALGQVATPPAVEDCRRRITQIETEVGILEREHITGGAYRERLDGLAQEKAEATARLAELEARWQKEKALIEELRGIRGRLEAHAAAGVAAAGAAASGPAATTAAPAGSPAAAASSAGGRLSDDEVAKLQADLGRLNAELAKVQGESPLMQVCVDGQTIAEVLPTAHGECGPRPFRGSPRWCRRDRSHPARWSC